jgi:hypothetical protein
MSFSESILTSVDKTVVSYISKIATLYSLDKEELISIWKGTNSSGGGGGEGTENEISKQLLALNRNELVELCKSKNLKYGGTKNDLIQRLVGVEKQTKLNFETSKQQQPTPPNLPAPKLIAKNEPFALKRNKFGNFEHIETGFVFNEVTVSVFGKQNADGTIAPLTVEDINICNKYKFAFNIPTKLTGLDDKVELAELDEDDVDVVEEEEEDEEEEEEEIEVELEIDDDD